MGKSILQKILAVLAKAMIRKYKPIIIGITGSVGKTSAKEAIFAVLKKKYRVRRAEKNLNTEIGLPLAILDAKYHHRNISKWCIELVKIFRKVIFNFDYPDILILEYGVDHPGDMDYLLSIAKPKIAVVTAIGDIPVHVEFFKDPDELVAEKAKLVAILPRDGYAILNHDDPTVFDMRKKTQATVMTHGADKDADVKITNYKLQTSKDEKLGDVPDGINFKVEHEGDVVPFRIHNVFGLPHVYATSAATAVGLVLNMNLVEISQAIEGYIPPPGRLRLLKGIKNSLILDDTYNAAPESMRAALDTLHALPGQRKIAIFGDMLEIGKYSEQAHRAMGDQAAGFVDLLFCIGPRAKFIADEAVNRNLNPAHIFRYENSESAGRALNPLIKEGDLILVKGSQALRMEKVVEEIMAHPEESPKLLVRQDDYWKNK